jgi:hypothetical protein
MMLGELSVTTSADPELFSPDGVVPFAIAEADARERAARWIRRTWLAPTKVARLIRSDALKRLYVPIWAFDARAIGYWGGPGVMRGIIEMDFFNLPISADRAGAPEWPLEIEAASIKSLRPFSMREIGMTAVAHSQRTFGEAVSLAHARIERELVTAAKRSRPPKERDKLNISRVEYAREVCRRLLVPIWQFDYRYLGRSYRIVIDGATGRVVGEAPKSLIKGALVTIALLWLVLLFGDAETALSIPERMAEGVRWLFRRSFHG